MKQKILIKLLDPNCAPVVNEKGDWYDLKAAKEYNFYGPKAETLKKQGSEKYRRVEFAKALIHLGVAIKLPKGYEAIVVPRSSTFKNFKLLQTNHIGIIDNSYCGNKDEWMMPVVALEEGRVSQYDRVCQFRIQLSQKATLWQKIKWLFTNGVKFVFVDDLKSSERGGFGSTGIK